MRITAAVLYDVIKPYSIETVELDPPRPGEVLVKVRAAGVCRSDLHFQKGEATIALPAVLGHEGEASRWRRREPHAGDIPAPPTPGPPGRRATPRPAGPGGP